MMISRLFVFTLIAGLVGCAPIPTTNVTASENCAYSVSKDTGSEYAVNQMANFVKSELRKEFGDVDRTFKINVSKKCGAMSERVVLTMNAKNYYITHLNDKKLPEKIETYNNRIGLDIDAKTFMDVVSKTNRYDFGKAVLPPEQQSYNELEEVYSKQRILKMYAFVFAEAARFDDAMVAVEKVFGSSCSIDWHDFDALVHNWKNISTFVIKSNDVKPSQIKGGGFGQLVAPITSRQTDAFVAALKSGASYEFNKQAPFLGYQYECGK